jgi:GT2 family glycosyltransferase
MLSPRLIAGSHPPAEYDADIIILMHNRLAETIPATGSALRQQNISLHVSVLDQGSSEGARAAFIAAFRHSPHFGYYVAEKNLGVGGGRNFLSGLGAGTCIVVLDNDAVFADDLVASRAHALFRESPRLGAIGFKILARDGIHLDEFSWGYPQGLKHAANGNFVATTFVGAGHAIRRTAWTQAGGYDADLFFTWEEYDFSLRAIALDWSILHAGSLAVIHNVSPEARIDWHSEKLPGIRKDYGSSSKTASSLPENGISPGCASCRASPAICSRQNATGISGRHYPACSKQFPKTAGFL